MEPDRISCATAISGFGRESAQAIDLELAIVAEDLAMTVARGPTANSCCMTPRRRPVAILVDAWHWKAPAGASRRC